MKKVTKLLAGVVLAASVAVTAGAVAGCAPKEEEKPAPQETTYTGEYSYVNWGNIYGVKVDVKVADGKIVSVAYSANQPEGWHNITPTWTEGQNKPTDLGHDKADAGLNDYLAKYVGMNVDDVLAIEVATAENGEPMTDDAALTAQGGLLYTGATQTSGRIILAVQDALSDTYTGSYYYSNSWGTYGVKVDVKVNPVTEKITSVAYSAEQPEGWVNVTPSWDADGSKAAGVPEYLRKYVGKTVDEVLAVEVPTTNGQPNTDDAAHTAQGDLLYTGATQTSGRIILAVQNALEDLAK